MTEYIERKVLDKALTVAAAADSDKRRRAWVEAISIVHDIPAADVAPVVHGKWIGVWGDGYANGFIVYEEFECSQCGCVHHADGEPTWDYCPQCGARMDGE